MNKTFQIAAVGLALQGLCVATAWAEGSTQGDGVAFVEGAAGQFGGNNGINRVVRSDGHPARREIGFASVRGNLDLTFTMPADQNGRFSPIFNPFNNKPSMYLGGEVAVVGGGATEVDGGVQFEPGTFPDIQGNIADVGWSVFFYVGNVRVNPRTYVGISNPTGNPWRGGTFSPTPNVGTGSVTGDMAFLANPDGRASMSFSAMSTTHGTVTSDTIYAIRIPNPRQPPFNAIPSPTHPLAPFSDATNPAPILFNTNLLTYSSMKRTVALTRPSTAGSKLDGMTMVGTWSGCELRPHNPPANAPNGGWAGWTWQQVNQRRTGYDVPREGHWAFNRRYNGRRTTHSGVILRFSEDNATNTAMRTPFFGTTEPFNSGRYSSETVSIDLGMIARPIGNPME